MNENQGLFGSLLNWFQHPFNSQGSALNWVLFLGLLIIAAWFWQHILLMIQSEV
jgi:hypothetical protein